MLWYTKKLCPIKLNIWKNLLVYQKSSKKVVFNIFDDF